ncbi:cardiolipin synthase [Corynebacterium heidelbergense]|uniref:Cardiolipin synthase n=1 Tax=Corynebacterium heidelbergense TaxID=2055947 RepID=A0A364VC89_9CORY|nr:cardiolipin synthase [Corynebacterium heidelbergense]RAV34186.1 cardiolipin synthase [Corynebacterium heidelbergense]WCZ35852.1 Cardiolipin synthase [Corynebacterium heidelbergense]
MVWDSWTHFVLDLSPEIQWWQIALLVADYALKIVALGWVPQDRKPSSAMAWLLAIFLIPFVGILLFFLMGSPFINRRRHMIQQRANDMLRQLGEHEPDVPIGARITPELRALVRLNRHLTALPSTGGTLQALHSEYEASIVAMAAAVDRARSYVNVEIYIVAWDQTTDVFFQALGRAVDRGVKVRLLYDHIGSLKYPGSAKLGNRLDALGIEWMVMLPLKPWRWRFRRPDLRNHRKLVVIDGETAFVGSQNMIDSSYLVRKNRKNKRHWVDIMAELSGPVVTEINSVFAVDWYTESGQSLDLVEPSVRTAQLDDDNRDTGEDLMQIVPSGPGFRTEPNLRLFTSMAHHAQQRLRIVSPYFIPDESLMAAVTTAAYRGVDVELYVSEKSDQSLVNRAQCSYYWELLKAGVRIFQYPYPAVLHTKLAIADDQVAVMGSANMDMRSFSLNYELTLMTCAGRTLDALNGVVTTYRRASHELTEDEWRGRPWYERYLDNVARLTSALQ